VVDGHAPGGGRRALAGATTHRVGIYPARGVRHALYLAPVQHVHLHGAARGAGDAGHVEPLGRRAGAAARPVGDGERGGGGPRAAPAAVAHMIRHAQVQDPVSAVQVGWLVADHGGVGPLEACGRNGAGPGVRRLLVHRSSKARLQSGDLSRPLPTAPTFLDLSQASDHVGTKLLRLQFRLVVACTEPASRPTRPRCPITSHWRDTSLRPEPAALL